MSGYLAVQWLNVIRQLLQVTFNSDPIKLWVLFDAENGLY